MTRGTASWLLGAALLFGLAHVAALPPWEGFDETGHYSYVQQIADGGGLPATMSARLSKDVEEWSATAPTPYAGFPLEENSGRTSYRSLFAGPPSAIAKARELVHGSLAGRRRYVPGVTWNWQAQHPPLYYLALVPVYWMTRDWSWGAHLLALRAVSYVFAWAALVLVAVCCVRQRSPAGTATAAGEWGPWAALGVVMWPFLVPSWVPEMGRLGNDSLACLLVAVVFALCAAGVKRGMTMVLALALGIALGLGCLAKIVFVPVALGTLVFWAVRLRHGSQARGLLCLALMVASCGIVGSSWYVGRVAATRSTGLAVLSGMADPLVTSGGTFRVSPLQDFAVGQALYGHYHLAEFAVWNGTWSQARPPIWSLAPLLLALAFWLLTLVWGHVRFRAVALASVPLWLGLPFVGMLSAYVLVRTALTGQGPYLGGYYIHILGGVLGAGIGAGAAAGWRHAVFRRLATLCAAYSIGFAAALTWAQLLLFAGILFLQGRYYGYRLPEVLPPFAGVPEAISRLDALAFPRLAAGLWVGGAIWLAAGLRAASLWLRYQNRASRARNRSRTETVGL